MYDSREGWEARKETDAKENRERKAQNRINDFLRMIWDNVEDSERIGLGLRGRPGES